jgi:type VI secretion system protein ImpG
VSFNKYYQDELVFLREMGREFVRAYPRLAPFLAGEGSDPDVERLLEGFAFLTGRMRQKLDDELPELTHSLIALLWPHFLRPIPAMSMLQFQPIPHIVSEKRKIPRGSEVDSVPVEGTPCRFRTCYDVEVYPLTLEQVEVHRTGAASTLRLEFVLNPGVSVDSLQLDSLRLYLHSEPFFVAQSLYLWFHRYLARITVQPVGERRAGQRFTLLRTETQTPIRPVGFADQEGLLPYPPNAFVGYRLLQEYFTLPQKFLFVDIMGLAPIAHLAIRDRFEIICEFSHSLEEQVRLTTDSIRLYCTPIVNLFPKDADPIRLEHNKKVEYPVRPSGRNLTHFEIYELDRVVGWAQGSGEQRVYQPFLSFDHSVTEDDRQTIYYRTRLVPAVLGRGADTYIAFVSPRDKQAFPPTEIVSIELKCTNRDLPEQLKVGDISRPTGSSPEFARFRNISSVIPSVLPPLDRGLHWQLISNMSLNYISLVHVEALRLILSTYNFQVYDDRDRQAARAHALRIEGLTNIRYTPLDRLLKGSPIRGLRIDMDMKGNNFASEGDMYLLASVLNEFFALYATINSFHQLVVRNTDRGEEYQWPARIGQQALL